MINWPLLAVTAISMWGLRQSGQLAYLFCLSFVSQMYVVFSFVVFDFRYQCNRLPGKTRIRSDLWCVDLDIKAYTLSLSNFYALLYRCTYK